MTTSKISSKGQVTIPLQVRRDLHLSPGVRVSFVKCPDGRYVLLAATRDIGSLKGIVKTNKFVSVEDMSLTITHRSEST